MKPVVFSQDISDNFIDREQKVSISIDTLNHDATADVKVFLQVEPPSVKDIRSPLIANHQFFDLVLAWHPDILNNCGNSRKFVFGSCWIDFPSECWNNKENEISYLTSNKNFTEGHRVRQSAYAYLQTKRLRHPLNDFSIRCVKTPPRIPNKQSIFKNAKFSVIVENESIPNWITEKLIDCLITKTVPIYWGAPNVGDFFNEDGILSFKNMHELGDIINNLNPEMYDNLKDVIEENYKLSLGYCDLHDRVDQEIDMYLMRK